MDAENIEKLLSKGGPQHHNFGHLEEREAEKGSGRSTSVRSGTDLCLNRPTLFLFHGQP